MPEADLFLQQLGFSEYEARAYIALLQRNPLNGYELAKTSGIPRANIYAVLQRLEERKAVIRIDSETSVQYAPVYPEQLIPQMGDHFQNILADAQCALEALSSPPEASLSRNILGYDALIDQARHMLNAAQEEIFIALWHSESQELAEDIARADERHVRLTTLCLQACSRPCDRCRGSIYRYHVQPVQMTRWMIVARDNREMLMGEIGLEQTISLRSNQPGLVQMTIQYVRSSIAWAAVVANAGNSLEQTLPVESKEILHVLGPYNSSPDWLSYVRGLINNRTS